MAGQVRKPLLFFASVISGEASSGTVSGWANGWAANQIR